jgi:hypothetical protein
MGLILFLVYIFEKNPGFLSKGLMFVSIMALPFMAYYDSRLTSKWIIAGEKTNEALNCLKKYDLTPYKNITILASPDKIERVGAMKLGLEQSVRYFSNNKLINVYYPLKSEIENYSKLELKAISDSSFLIYGNNVRLLPLKGKSSAIFTNDTVNYDDGRLTIKIINFKLGNSTAIISFINKMPDNIAFYFDGKYFRQIPDKHKSD